MRVFIKVETTTIMSETIQLLTQQGIIKCDTSKLVNNSEYFSKTLANSTNNCIVTEFRNVHIDKVKALVQTLSDEKLLHDDGYLCVVAELANEFQFTNLIKYICRLLSKDCWGINYMVKFSNPMYVDGYFGEDFKKVVDIMVTNFVNAVTAQNGYENVINQIKENNSKNSKELELAIKNKILIEAMTKIKVTTDEKRKLEKEKREDKE
jgi:hypothetical protein